MAGPASIRANNPGNIKTGVGWLGACGTTAVAEGVNDVFATPVYGARALAKNIQAKFDGRASNTNELMNILSPTSENNTSGYVIPSVVNYMQQNGYPNFTQYTPIVDSFNNDRAFGTTFMQAITYMEQAGAERAFPKEVLQAGWDAKNKGIGEFDPNQFGDGSENGFEGCNGQNVPQEEEGEDTVSDTSGEGGEQRNDAAAPSAGAGGEYGFKDPDATFPVPEYQQEKTLAQPARYEWKPKLVLPEGNPFYVPQNPQPKYHYNKVTESTNPNPEQRHRLEIDDTPSDPRVTFNHKCGTGIEMLQEEEMLVVNSKGKTVQLVGADFNMYVFGDGQVVYNGNLNLTVKGDMNLTVEGDMKTTVKGHKTEVVEKDVVEEIQGTQETTVTDHKSLTVGKINTELVLGSKNTFVKRKQANWVEGKVEFLSKDFMHISSETKMSIAAANMKIATTLAQWHALGGTIGGEGVYHYGYAWDGTLRVIGDLLVDDDVTINQSLNVISNVSVGGGIDAQDSIASASDLTAFALSTTNPSAAIISDISTQYTEPTNANIANTLYRTDEGVMSVDVDPGNKIKQAIDIRERIKLGLGLE